MRQIITYAVRPYMEYPSWRKPHQTKEESLEEWKRKGTEALEKAKREAEELKRKEERETAEREGRICPVCGDIQDVSHEYEVEKQIITGIRQNMTIYRKYEETYWTCRTCKQPWYKGRREVDKWYR